MEDYDQEKEADLDEKAVIVDALRGFPIEASQQVWWRSSEFGEVSLKYVVLQYPGVDLSLYSMERKWMAPESGTRHEKFTFNDRGEIIALERWKIPAQLSDDLRTFTEELEHQIGIMPDVQDYETLRKIITTPGEIRYDGQPYHSESPELIMPAKEKPSELALDSEMLALKMRWLDESARFNQTRGRDQKSDNKEMQRLMIWLLELQRAGITITDLEMIEAGMDPWSEE